MPGPKIVSEEALEDKAAKGAVHVGDHTIHDRRGASRRPFRRDRDARGRGVRWTRRSQPWCLAVAICPYAKEMFCSIDLNFNRRSKSASKGSYEVRAPFLPRAEVFMPSTAQANQPATSDCSTCDPTAPCLCANTLLFEHY